jgi:hypothetical protein
MGMRLKKRTLVLLGAAVVAIGIAVGAYAYFTTTGSGSGTATVGTSSNLVLAGSTTGTLYPGTTVPVSFTALNNSPGHQQLGTIYLVSAQACSVAWVGDVCNGGSSGVGDIAGCGSVDPGNALDANANDLYMADVVSNQDFGPGASPQAVTATGTLKMNNLNASQDACKNANLYLSFATR